METIVSECDLVLDAKAELGDGPLWDDRRQRLVFVDVSPGQIHEFDPATGLDRIVSLGQSVGSVALTTRGDWVVAASDGFYRVEPETGRKKLVARVEADQPQNRMNDGYVDAKGRFWAGTMNRGGLSGRCGLYCLDTDGKVRQMLTGVSNSNGLDWSPDTRTFYHTDLGVSRVDQFDFDVEAGAISNRRVFMEFSPEIGFPDGLIVDAAGYVWVALWEGGSLHRYAPDGRLDLIVPLPVSQTTKCAFGGPELKDLYVTTARVGLDEKERRRQTHAGGLFRCRPGMQGQKVRRYAG